MGATESENAWVSNPGSMTQIAPMIRVQGLAKRVASPEGELTILAGVDLTVARGDTVAIMGASGSGKSTLLALMAGLDLPSSGDVVLAEKRLLALDEDGRAALRARHVGFVFQSFQLLGSLTALENVMLALELGGHQDALSRALNILARVGLAERVRHYPNQLSGGEQQRVAIARAFAPSPDILFADEPTGNLDQRTGQQIAQLLFELNRAQGTTLVLVTHDVGLARSCRRQVELVDGYAVDVTV